MVRPKIWWLFDIRESRKSQCFQGVSALLEKSTPRTVIETRNWRDTTFATPRICKLKVENGKLKVNFVVVSYVVNPEFWPFFRSWWSTKSLVFVGAFGSSRKFCAERGDWVPKPALSLLHRRIVLVYRLRKSAALTTPCLGRFRCAKTTLSCFWLATFATPRIIFAEIATRIF